MSDYNFIIKQIRHWFSTFPNDYLGSGYGIDLNQYMFIPINDIDTNEILEKMFTDIPVLSSLDSGLINVGVSKNEYDRVVISVLFDDSVLYSRELINVE